MSGVAAGVAAGVATWSFITMCTEGGVDVTDGRDEDVGTNIAVGPEGEDAAAEVVGAAGVDMGKMPRPSREAVVAMQRQPLPPVATMAA